MNIRVRSTDKHGLSREEAFVVTVRNVAPSRPASGTGFVTEGASNGTSVGITVSSTDPNGGAVTYVLTDSSFGRFKVNPTTGVVTVNNSSLINREDAAAYSITSRASDGNLNSSTRTHAIFVNNVAPTTPTDSNGATNAVAEGAGSNTLVGITAKSTDPNGTRNGGGVRFSLANSAGNRVKIDSTSGVVSVRTPSLINYESATSHNIVVQASDGIGGVRNKTFTITVTNVPLSTPTDVNTAPNRVAEAATTGTVVGLTARSFDPNGPAPAYLLTNDADGRFQINASSGVVTVKDGTKLNFEDAMSHAITVEAAIGAEKRTASFTIDVTNVDPSDPADDNSATNEIVEAGVNGSAVGITAKSTDPNGPAVIFDLTDNAGGRFDIDSSSGVVTVADSTLLNHETAANHEITVRASDGKGGTATKKFNVNVTNVLPSVPTDNNPTVNAVAEDAANGDLVGVTALSTDPNGPAVQYSLTNDADGRFAIDVDTGVVSVSDSGKIDYETDVSHTITVQADDGAGGTRTENFTIDVTNVRPSDPADDDPAPNEVEEGAVVDTVVGLTASATDPNGGTVTYSLTDNAGGRFKIDANSGEVTVASATLLSFESATSHNVTVQASDGLLTSAFTFTINVLNVDPTDPTDDDLADNEVSEDAANDALVGLTAASSDPNGPAVAYSLTNNADGRFKINATTGVVSVADTSLINFEEAPSHDITVQASDGHGGTAETTFTIDITNVAPTVPTDANLADNAVDEGAGNGTLVGITASSTDPKGPNVVFSLTDNAGGRFEIDSITGEVSVADSTLLDFETAIGHSITVQATDGTAPVTQMFTIDVINVAPNAPVDSDDVTADEVDEGAVTGTVVGVTASSFDPNGPAVVYSLTDDAGGRFQIDSATGIVTVANGSLLDFETSASHTITAKAEDPSGAAMTSDFIITVLDINEAPVATDETGAAIEDGPSVNIPTGTDDEDGDDDATTLVYTILSLPSEGSVSSNGDGSFTFDPGSDFQNLATGETREVTFTYKATDSHMVDSNTGTVTIEVTGVNDAPVAVNDTASTDENTGKSINVVANDTDVDGDDHPANFSLDSLDGVSVSGLGIDPTLPAGVVTISGNQVLFTPGTVFDELDSTDAATVTVNYTMSDDEGATSSAVLVLTVNGVNDAPTVATTIADATTIEDGPNEVIELIGVFADVDADDQITVSVSGNTNPLLVSTSIVGTTLTLVLLADANGTADITIRGTDIDGAFAEDTFTLTVLSATDQLQGIVQIINALQNAGVLNGGNTNALIAKINGPIDKLANDQDTAAVNQLNAFIKQVDAFIKTNKLTDAEGEELKDLVDDAIHSISTTGGSALVSEGTSGAAIASTDRPLDNAGELLIGSIGVSLSSSVGDVTAEQAARLDDALVELNAKFGPYGLTLVALDGQTTADAEINVAIADESACGGLAEGILGCTAGPGEITIIAGWNWHAGADTSTIGAGQYDFQTVLTHEVGHAVGLTHSGDSVSVMYSWLLPAETKHSLSAQDLDLLAPHDGSTPTPMRAMPSGIPSQRASEVDRAIGVVAADGVLAQQVREESTNPNVFVQARTQWFARLGRRDAAPARDWRSVLGPRAAGGRRPTRTSGDSPSRVQADTVDQALTEEATPPSRRRFFSARHRR